MRKVRKKRSAPYSAGESDLDRVPKAMRCTIAYHVQEALDNLRHLQNGISYFQLKLKPRMYLSTEMAGIVVTVVPLKDIKNKHIQENLHSFCEIRTSVAKTKLPKYPNWPYGYRLRKKSKSSKEGHK